MTIDTKNNITIKLNLPKENPFFTNYNTNTTSKILSFFIIKKTEIFGSCNQKPNLKKRKRLCSHPKVAT